MKMKEEPFLWLNEDEPYGESSDGGVKLVLSLDGDPPGPAVFLSPVYVNAPKMLEALRGLFANCAMIHKHWGDGDNTQETNAAIKFAEDVIARAEGRT